MAGGRDVVKADSQSIEDGYQALDSSHGMSRNTFDELNSEISNAEVYGGVQQSVLAEAKLTAQRYEEALNLLNHCRSVMDAEGGRLTEFSRTLEAVTSIENNKSI